MSEHDVTLVGSTIHLVPARIDDAAELWPLTDDALWRGMTQPRPASPTEHAAHLGRQLATPGLLAFTVRDAVTGAAQGATTLYDLVPAQRRVEIGSTWYGRAWWGGRTNPEAKLLLFSYAFDSLGLERVALRCDVRNERSARAIRRLGATPEGVLRRHRVAADGTVGDTAYFSVLRDEWPEVRAGLEDRLAPRAG